jgi:hypothetical protein
MLITITKLLLLRYLLLHKCEMGYYLSIIVKTCKIEYFELSMYTHTEMKIMPPPQCKRLAFRPIDNVGPLDLSDCSDLSQL